MLGGMPGGGEGADSGFMKEIMTSVPGIDEATSFGEILKSLDEYKFDLIIFDDFLLNNQHLIDLN